MVTPEQDATREVRLAASSRGMRIFRNNAGACKDERGNFIRYGLGNDGSTASKNLKFGDYIGYLPVTITPEMVGKTVAVFSGIEIKPDGHIEKTLRKAERQPTSREGLQFKTIMMVREAGGISWFASNKADIDAIVEEYLWGLQNDK